MVLYSSISELMMASLLSGYFSPSGFIVFISPACLATRALRLLAELFELLLDRLPLTFERHGSLRV